MTTGRRRRTLAAAVALVVCVLLGASTARAQDENRFPSPEFDSGYTFPQFTEPQGEAWWHDVLYVAAMVVGLSLATFFALRLRSRNALAVLSVASLGFFGFYMAGCVCPIGAIGNVSEALFLGAAIPVTVVVIFALPLVFALLFGRVFCSSVCPLGAIQDVVLLRPVRVPLWLQYSLGLLPYVYVGAAVLMAATGSGYLICRYDPFVSMFRLDGEPAMFLWGGSLLALAMFVGRPYCRFLCPLGALLGMCSRVARWRVKTTPDECVNCRLCEDACPYGAIRAPTREEGPR